MTISRTIYYEGWHDFTHFSIDIEVAYWLSNVMKIIDLR